MNARIIWPLTAAILLAGVVFVLTHLGAYPQIQSTVWFTGLLLFVTANTLGFAMAAAVKMGFQSGRRASRASAQVTPSGPPEVRSTEG